MFKFSIEDSLIKKLNKIAKKDKILAKNFSKKVQEVINQNLETINTYKTLCKCNLTKAYKLCETNLLNLKSPKNEFKRIHLTDNFILLFKVLKKEEKLIFIDILHWKKASVVELFLI